MEKTLDEELQQEMLSPFVCIFSVLSVEVR